MDNLKSCQRKEALAARAAISESQRQEYNNRIARRLAEHPALKNAGYVMSYMAFDHEADPAPLHAWLLEQGAVLCFPHCGSGGHMEALRPLDSQAWELGKFGIMSPIPERSQLISPELLDVVICPCLAFDSSLHRLGWGGGYYDRYLPRCTKAISIAIAFQCQHMDKLICDHPFEAVLDAVATEERWYR